MGELSVAEVLERAADLIQTKGWTTGAYVRDDEGRRDDWRWPDEPKCFCALGALAKSIGEVAPNYFEFECEGLAGQVVSQLGFDDYSDIARWNDHPDRTQPEVVAKLREAAALARQSHGGLDHG